MKICQFTPIFLPTLGGVGGVIHQLAFFLTEAGHHVTVLAPKRRGESVKMDVPYRIFRYQRPSSKRFGVHQMLFYLIWEKMMRGFDILHCHSAYPQGYVGASFKKMFQTPLVITSYGDLVKGERVREDAFLAKRAARALKRADAVTAVSYFMKEESIEAGASEETTYCIPNGVDLKDFQSEEKFVFDKPYLFSMGIIRKVKGFDVLIRAFQEVKRAHPELSLFIAGVGKEMEGLKKLTNDLHLQDSIHFLGVLSDKEKVKMLKGCEFYVCSAIREEPFSNSTLEAFASGKTVVASNVGGVPDLVEDQITGLLVPPGDPDLLARKLIDLLDHPALIREMSLNANNKSREFSLETTMNKYLRLYGELLNRR
jgi:glycosyltransferase involved in cell wall biosynthesis